jgi:hypothetical protein
VGRQGDKSFSALKTIHKAKRELLKAQRSAGHINGVSRFHSDYARTLVEEVSSLLAPEHPVKITVGREALPDSGDRALAGVRETLLDPDTISIESSASRLELLADADVVALGVDAFESINAMNSLEKMLAHQLAAAHRFSLKHLALIDRTKDNLEKLRLTNAAARMMESFQNGMKLLHRIRSGGRQVMVVQHVQVGQGGQAVIAGEVQSQKRGQ